MTFKSMTVLKKPLKPSKPLWNPRPYMKKAMKWLLGQANAALFLDPGLGKTSVTLASFKVLKDKGLVRGMLVVAPLRPALTVWPKEIAKWSNFENLDLVVLRGKEKDILVTEQHDVYVINYESLDFLFARRHPLKKDGAPHATHWNYYVTEAGKNLLKRVDVLVWDELSKMKHSNTLRFKLVRPHLHRFARKWGLTGSPAANGLLNLFGQCYVLDEGRSLGSYISHYKTQYFYPVDRMGYTYALKPGAEKAIQERLRPLALRMEAEDYIELPKELNHYIKLDFPDKVRKQYDEMERDFLSVLGAATVTAVNKAVAQGKCRQICSGAIWLGEGTLTKAGRRAWEHIHDIKLDALEELLGELQDQQVLLAYEFGHDLERLLKRFPKTPYIGGGVSEKKGVEIENEWNKGRVQLLFGHPASIGHGLNLQESNAHHIIHFTPTWDFETYDQFNRRLRRSGNAAETLHIYHLTMRNTVEESVLYALKRKFKTQKELLDAIKERVRVGD